MAENMPENLKQVSCDPECGFMVKSHDEQEVVDMALEHVRRQHPDMQASAEDVKGRVTEA